MLTILAYSAQYTPFATAFAGTFPLVCILAYLITPLAPAEDDPTEPPTPKVRRGRGARASSLATNPCLRHHLGCCRSRGGRLASWCWC